MANMKTLVIDNDLRIITIPPSITHLGVEADEAVLQLHFSMPRMYGEIDLAAFTIRINYMNAGGEGDVALAKDKTVTGDGITFSWEIGRKVTKYKGKVKFIACLKRADDQGVVLQEFNTAPAALPVLTGLETEETPDAEDFPEILEQVLQHLDEVEQDVAGVVRHNEPQDLTDEQKAQALDNIGAQPKGNYLTEAPVTSVNGQTGAVKLSAQDVGARPGNWTPTAQDVGADPSGAAAGAVSGHNVATDAHSDLRLLIEALTNRLNAVADSDDTTLDQLSELVDYIKDNRELIEQITTGKVSVSDIVNNLTTNTASRPLSASQGVVLKSLIDGVVASLANYQPKGNYLTEAPVTSVNGKTGAVKLNAADVGALPKETEIPEAVNIDDALVNAGQAADAAATGDAIAAKAPAITETVEGTTLAMTDSAEQRLAGLRLFGRSTQDGTPTPDAPVEIKSLENPTVMVYGKNLLPPYTETTEMQGIQITHNTDGSITLDGTATARAILYFVRSEKRQNIGPGAYVLSMGAVLPADCTCVFERYVDGVWQSVICRVQSGASFVAFSTDVAINIASYLEIKPGAALDGLTLRPQLELAESATEYEQHKQPQILALPYTLHGIPVTSGGNYTDETGQAWLCDEIDLERGVHIQRVRCTDRVKISSYGTLDSGLFFGYWNIPDKKYQPRNGLISNVARYVSSSQAAEGTVYENAMNVVFVGAADDNLQTIKAKYENSTLCYVLAEPIETALTAAEITAYKALLTNRPTTSIINDAGAYMRAEHVVDTKTYINSQSGAAPGVTPEQIAQAVADYLKENPIDAGSKLTIGVVELIADKWIGDTSPYSQVVEVPGATPYSQVDLTPSVEQLAIFHDKDLAFVTENEDGVVTVYAIGDKPSNDYTMQVTIKEVSV